MKSINASNIKQQYDKNLLTKYYNFLNYINEIINVIFNKNICKTLKKYSTIYEIPCIWISVYIVLGIDNDNKIMIRELKHSLEKPEITSLIINRDKFDNISKQELLNFFYNNTHNIYEIYRYQFYEYFLNVSEKSIKEKNIDNDTEYFAKYIVDKINNRLYFDYCCEFYNLGINSSNDFYNSEYALKLSHSTIMKCNKIMEKYENLL